MLLFCAFISYSPAPFSNEDFGEGIGLIVLAAELESAFIIVLRLSKEVASGSCANLEQKIKINITF